MIEASAILIVFLISVLIYVGARVHARNSRLNPAEEIAELTARVAWHEDRLRRAQARHGDEAMIRQIADQLAAARRDLDRIRPPG